MKKSIIILITFFFFTNIYAQESATQEVKTAIVKEYNKWLIKSDFETTADYENRVKTQGNKALKEITDDTTYLIKEKHINSFSFGFGIGSYDIENESFAIKKMGDDSRYESSNIRIKVNKNIAERFYNIFNSDEARSTKCSKQ